MRTDDFDYPLPEELIAQEPWPVRDECRLLVMDRESGALQDRIFKDIAEYVRPGDVFVVNETRVRPAVANDGGDITFRGFKDGIVYLNMKGACSGCPSSTATLRHGIQNLLKHYVPEVVEVRPV